MSTKVHASVTVNPLQDFRGVSNTYGRYLAEQSLLDVDYTQYSRKDSKIGNTREITFTSNLGSNSMKLIALDPTTADNPTSIDTTQTEYSEYTHLDFQPLVEIKSDRHPLGLLKDPPNSKDRVKSERLLKAMNTTLERVSTSILDTSKIPAIGSNDWGKYGTAYRTSSELSGRYSSESSYRVGLVKDNKSKAKQLKDITDVSIGYFGTFNEKNTISPKATYYTFLSILNKLPIKNTSNQVDKTARKFKLLSNLYEAVYTINGFIHREVVGKISNKVGNSKILVELEDDKPLDTLEGSILHSDFDRDNLPYFDRDQWSGEGLSNHFDMPKHYVSIQVQIEVNKYVELILVDLYQETTIEGNGISRVGNSGYLDSSQGELTWKEGFIAESFIPLTKYAMLKVKLFDRSRLIAESKCSFIQSINVTHIKWYQSGIIGAIVSVVSVLLSMYTLGVSITINSLVQTLLTGFVVGLASDMVIKILVDLDIISSSVGIALLALVGTYYAKGILNLNLDLSLASTASQLVEATGKVYKEQTIKLSKEYKDKISKLEEEIGRLDGMTEEFITSNYSSIVFSINRELDNLSIPLVETRDEFMARTLNRRTLPLDLIIDRRI